MKDKKTTDKNSEETPISKEHQVKARELSEEANPKEVFYNVDGKAVDDNMFGQTKEEDDEKQS